MTPPVITVVHCWSAPRSRSTALLYSFEARWNANADNTNACPTVAIDEPLYRRWLLDKGDAVIRPYTNEMIEGVVADPKSRTTSRSRTQGKDAVIDSVVVDLSAEEFKKRVKGLEEQMYSLARDLEFEKAAQMRDEIAKLKEAHFGVSTKAA